MVCPLDDHGLPVFAYASATTRMLSGFRLHLPWHHPPGQVRVFPCDAKRVAAYRTYDPGMDAGPGFGFVGRITVGRGV